MARRAVGDRCRRFRDVPAVHTDGAATDWAQVLALYDQLLNIAPTPIVLLNRAVAAADVHGPAVALAALDDIELPGYHLLPATRADLLIRLGRDDEAAAAYDQAIALPANETERAFLQTRRAGLNRSGLCSVDEQNKDESVNWLPYGPSRNQTRGKSIRSRSRSRASSARSWSTT